MLNLTIREVEPTDLPTIYGIERISFKRPYEPSFIRALAFLNPQTFLVAKANGNIVGYVVAVIRGRSLGHIFSIAVHPNYRKRGIGKRLMQHITEKLKNTSVTNIRVEVRKSNAIAQKMYKHLGFKTVYAIKSYYEDGEDALVMFKSLI